MPRTRVQDCGDWFLTLRRACRVRASRTAALALPLAVGALLTCGVAAAGGADLTVRQDGSGRFRTIQACADAAGPGDRCIVSAGVYPEHIETARGGTGDAARVTFKADGVVTMRGFEIRHPYVTVDGFDVTGYGLVYGGHINVSDDGDSCQVLNNTIRDGATNVVGLYIAKTGGRAADGCVIRGNRLRNLRYVFLVTNGNGHLFEGNTFEEQNNMDLVRLAGTNHVFRRNVFWQGTTATDLSGHPDFVQVFGQESTPTENHLFEENWIQNLTSQFGQMNSGDGVVTKGILYGNVKNIVFRRNVILSLAYNANIGMPGVRFENNTFYRLAYSLSGISFGGSLTRGDATGGTLTSNVFLAGGARAALEGDASGYYSMSGGNLSKEVIAVFVTQEKSASGAITSLGPIAAALFDELRGGGYINSNGQIQEKARLLREASQLALSGQYGSYRVPLYDVLMKTVQLDSRIRESFFADYNFVAGSELADYPAKRSSGCIQGATYTPGNFCEPHGINGGSPEFRDLANPLGPDGIPFTLDDGLKPRPGSPLCGKGMGGADIGAYSCDPSKVFPNQPKPPANVTIR